MNVILFSVSKLNPNDPVINGLLHFGLESYINKHEPVYARYVTEDNCLSVRWNEQNTELIQFNNDTEHSNRYLCIQELLSRMKIGDCLMADRLDDLGRTAKEAKAIYFDAVDKGIDLAFFDSSYLDSNITELNEESPITQKRYIQRIINNYYRQKGNEPILSTKTMENMAVISDAKKK